MKYCKKCDTEKPKIEFSKDKKSKDGLQYSCKSCNRAFYEANIEDIAEKKRKYQESNKEDIAERKREWYETNREDIAAYQRNYYADNKEDINAYQRGWRVANLDRVAAKSRNRRAMKRAAEGTHTAADVKAIFESQRGLCANCGKKLFKSGKKIFHADHIMPLARGGSNDKYNLQCLCPECNQRKHAKDPLDWAKENEKLL